MTLLFMAVALLQLISIGSASAATHISAQNYTSNVTWTAANSPYILDGSVTVKPGATLTINPGVVIKFNGITRWLTIEGTLTANGAKDNRIVFTSLKDDSVGGDDGGDGPTNGAPGDWTWILVKGSASLTWADVRYGGYGSSDTAYGAINVQGGQVTIDRAHITDNQRAGIVNTLHGAVSVNRTLVARNAVGVYTNNSSLALGDGSEVGRNTSMGLWFSLLSTYTGPRSTIMDSDVRGNGSYGAYLTVPSTLSATLWPAGNRDNIYGNNGGLSTQLYSQNANRSVDWKGNFWGPTVTFFANGAGCNSGSPAVAGYLAYDPITISPPAGPIRRTTFLRGSVTCYADMFDVGPADFATTYIDHNYGVDGPPEDYSNTLQLYEPDVAYDSGENYHVVSPAALTDFAIGDAQPEDSNSLKDPDGLFAIADEQVAINQSLDKLTLGYLAPRYPAGGVGRRANDVALSTDFVSARGNETDGFYEGDARSMEPALGDWMYVRAVAGSDGTVWLQYWFFYYFNPPPVLFGASHEGDWEMVQIGLGPDFAPEGAAYAQHGSGQKCDWPSVELDTSGHPVVFVGESSHASFFEAHYDQLDPEHADGQGGGMTNPRLQQITATDPAWVAWPGKWGDSGDSPGGPQFDLSLGAGRAQWFDPTGWAASLTNCD